MNARIFVFPSLYPSRYFLILDVYFIFIQFKHIHLYYLEMIVMKDFMILEWT